MSCVSSQTLVFLFNISFCFLELLVPILCSSNRNYVDLLTGHLQNAQSGLILEASSESKNNL